MEELVDFCDRVDFQNQDAQPHPQTVLIGGKSTPMVVIHSFLDLSGRRQAAYASPPSDKAKTCNVMLRWNSEEGTIRPSLETVSIKTLDGNP